MGKLLWVCGQTRPGISFEVCQLVTNIKNSDESSIKKVNKLFSNMKQNECKLIYEKLGNDNELQIIVYSDAAHRNLPNGGSQGGYISFFMWISKYVCSIELTIKMHTKSSTEFACS